MMELSGFSDFLSQLNPFFQPPQAEDAAEKTAGSSSVATAPPATPDVFSSSGGSVADAGAYEPMTMSAGRRAGFALNMSFNLSIQREATIVQSDPETDRNRAVLNVFEASSLSYQSSLLSSQRAVGNSFGEVRRFQADLFYSRASELSTRLEPEVVGQFEEASRRVSRTFEMDISLDVSFLNRFVGQSEEISGLDGGLFEQYLNNTNGLPGTEDLQGFFNEVDRILADAEGFLQDTLGSFFNEVAASFGLTEDEAARLQGAASDQITAFFDEVDQLLEEARGVFGVPGKLPEAEQAPAVEEGVDALEGETDPELV